MSLAGQKITASLYLLDQMNLWQKCYKGLSLCGTITYMIRQLKAGERIPDSEPRRYPRPDGYVRLRWKIGVREYVEVYEHRIVDGVWVTEAPQVHHKNRNKSDNKKSNLKPLTTGEHGKEHRTIDDVLVVEMYNSGMSYPEIAKATGWNHGAVCRAAHRSGLKLRSYDQSWNAAQIDEWRLIELHEQGWSASKIATELDTTRAVIYNRIKKLGLKPLPVGRHSTG